MQLFHIMQPVNAFEMYLAKTTTSVKAWGDNNNKHPYPQKLTFLSTSSSPTKNVTHSYYRAVFGFLVFMIAVIVSVDSHTIITPAKNLLRRKEYGDFRPPHTLKNTTKQLTHQPITILE
jgi:hypothetical protein